MHRLNYTTKRIAPDQLPIITKLDGSTRAATDAELLNFGIRHLADDVYDVVEQETRVIDDDTGDIQWLPKGEPVAGDIITQGARAARYANLPSDVRSKVICARVIRDVDNKPIRATVQQNLDEAKAAFAEHVGDIKFAPMSAPLSLTSDDVEINDIDIVDEARRLMYVAAVMVTVPLAEVADDDVVDTAQVVPHGWAGEAAR